MESFINANTIVSDTASKTRNPLGTDSSWQQELRNSVRSLDDLIERLELPLDHDSLTAAQKLWSVRAPEGFLSRIEPGNLRDPLLLQILPDEIELSKTDGYLKDPLQESLYSPAQGIVHKYHGRALLIMTGSCAIHCRYCFRREFDYESHRLAKADWQNSLEYIRVNTELSEIILSGGDPLMLGDSALNTVLSELENIPHIRTVRFHSRLPIVLPSRVTDSLLETISSRRFKTVFVIHCNHRNELDDSVGGAIGRLNEKGITVFNQSVLLRNVNDSVKALEDLNRDLFTLGVIPYYLHVLDRVVGSAHFEVGMDRAIELHHLLALKLPGYLLPKLVIDRPGQGAKTVISSCEMVNDV